jgi:phosphopantetheine--protein transferase-like protein
MIVGLGIDLVEIDRIRRAMENPRFIQRILTPLEREYAVTPFQVAGRWAAKEAVAKAIGLKLKWHQIEILPNEFGEPVAEVKSPDYDLKRMRLKISISHERTHAVAVAILERMVIHSPMF